MFKVRHNSECESSDSCCWCRCGNSSICIPTWITDRQLSKRLKPPACLLSASAEKASYISSFPVCILVVKEEAGTKTNSWHAYIFLLFFFFFLEGLVNLQPAKHPAGSNANSQELHSHWVGVKIATSEASAVNDERGCVFWVFCCFFFFSYILLLSRAPLQQNLSKKTVSSFLCF